MHTRRHLFDIPEEITYLNCAYMSPLLTSAAEAGKEGVARKCQPWAITEEDFFDKPQRSRSLFAQVIGAEADSVAIIPSVSYGMAIAARNIPVEKGQTILLLDKQFPSNVYPWQALAEEKGAVVRFLTRLPEQSWTEVILEAMDASTALLACPHTHWMDGGRLDLVSIGKRCREMGAALVIDGTQSIGAVPFDVSAIQPDMVVCASYKWLFGPYSYGYLYVAPTWHAGTPVEQNWINRQGSEHMASLSDYQKTYQPGAMRYNVGECSNFALTPMAIEGLTHILEWGVETISEHARTLTEYLIDACEPMGITPLCSHERSPHILMLGSAPELQDKLLPALKQAQIYVSVRGSGIRISPNVYNGMGDVEQFVDVLQGVSNE